MTLDDIFSAAMSVMDELGQGGTVHSTDAQPYAYRTPSIINILSAELRTLLGNSEDWTPYNALSDSLQGETVNWGVSVAPYGLAAHLLVEENPPAAAFFQQRYEEMLRKFISNQPAEMGEIENVYGAFAHTEFGQW